MSKETFLDSTLTYCPACKQTELAWYVQRERGVYLESTCLQVGERRTKVAADPLWFRERMLAPQGVACVGTRESVKGCPFDCGLCEFHTGALRLPVFSITNVCNLDCPICFTFNRRDRQYYKSVEEMEQTVEKILAQAGQVDLINITGGEPTLHPNLAALLEVCQRDEIGRITLNSNGVRLARDRSFALMLKQAGVQLVLSLDTLDPEKSMIIHGVDMVELKRQALATLEELHIPTTILAVCIKNVNETDVVDIVHRYFPKPFVRSVTIQNMTFTGQNGRQFVNGPLDRPHEHITMDEVEGLVASRGRFAQSDFFPLGSYHPLCYSVGYYIVHGSHQISLSRLVSKQTLVEASQDSYLLNPGSHLARHFLDGVNRLWAEGEDPVFIRVLRDFFDELFPVDRKLTTRERVRVAEKMIKPIYIHPHMDADTFDIGRVSRCGDIVPDESGRMIPACAYNLIHRQQDTRFWVRGQ